MKRIVIDIFEKEEGKLNGLVEIESKELEFKYGNGGAYHGLQMFECDKYWEDVYESVLVEFNDKIRLLNEIYNLVHNKGEK